MASRVRQKVRARSATLCTRGEYNGQDSDIIRLELLRKRSQSGSIPRTAGLNMTTAPMVDHPPTKDPSYRILLPLMLYYLMVGQARIARVRGPGSHLDRRLDQSGIRGGLRG